MVVQRKWMYLESIFIGGDIRAQLPEEAKKFDDIDKTFKKVCKSDTLTRLGRNVHARYWQKKFLSRCSGNGKENRKFLRAGKSRGILF